MRSISYFRYNGLVYRRVASKDSLALEFKRILEANSRKLENAVKNLTQDQLKGIVYVQKLSYQNSKALAQELNEAVHLEYETYVNLFGVQQYDYFENLGLCSLVVDTPFEEQIYYCPKLDKRPWLCDKCKVGWSFTPQDLAARVDALLLHQKELSDPASLFLAALVQHGSDFGFRAVPTRAQGRTVKIEIGQAYIELTQEGKETVKLDYFVAFGAKSGWGSKVLNIVVGLADRYCVQLKLFASPMVTFTHIPEFEPRPKGQRMDLKKLMEFYHRFGFDPIFVHKWGADMERTPHCEVG